VMHATVPVLDRLRRGHVREAAHVRVVESVGRQRCVGEGGGSMNVQGQGGPIRITIPGNHPIINVLSDPYDRALQHERCNVIGES
jgi:hypothetical protein